MRKLDQSIIFYSAARSKKNYTATQLKESMNASKQKIFEFKKKMLLGSLKSRKILIDILLIKLTQFEKTRSLFFFAGKSDNQIPFWKQAVERFGHLYTFARSFNKGIKLNFKNQTAKKLILSLNKFKDFLENKQITIIATYIRV